jgi:flagellar basal body rod protein FlgG
MDSGYYAAMTGLVARSQALDTAAANLANAQTPGYRAEREFFRSVLLGPDALNSQLGRTVNNYGLLGGDRLDMDQGALTATGNPLDLAIEGEGFFQVETANGLRYTQLTTQNNALSEVNLNDEASAMSTLQSSYQAASQVFTMLNTIMAAALNLGDQTTVA